MRNNGHRVQIRSHFSFQGAIEIYGRCAARDRFIAPPLFKGTFLAFVQNCLLQAGFWFVT
jgi:hypothetical protein